MNKLHIANRLGRLGLRDVADAYEDEVRQRIAREKGGPKRDREAVKNAARDEMWKLYEPLCERIEQIQDAPPPPPPPISQLAGLPDNLTEVINPDYAETNVGRQLRDGWLWAATQWALVIRDTESGPVATLNLANTPPPNSFALTVLSIYALSDIDKRRELIAKALQFAEKSHDETETPTEDTEGFLDQIS